MENILKIRSEVHKVLKKNPIQILRTSNILPYGEKTNYVNILPDKESLLFFVPNDTKNETSVVYESSIKFDSSFLQTANNNEFLEIYNALIIATNNTLYDLYLENYEKWLKDFKQKFIVFDTFRPDLFYNQLKANGDYTYLEHFRYQKSRYYFSFMTFENVSTKGLALANKIAPSTLKICNHLKSKVPNELKTLGIFPGYKIYKKSLDEVVWEELK